MRWICVCLILLAAPAFADDAAKVEGSDLTFEKTVTRQVGDSKNVKLNLTGTAVREKFFVNIYALGSYVEFGTPVDNAEELAKADVPKILELKMEREVGGADMATAFVEAIRANYAAPEFEDEVKLLVGFFKEKTVKVGDVVKFVHLPAVGVQIEMKGQDPFRIKGLKFARAVWDIYLGKENIGEAVKKGLLSRL